MPQFINTLAYGKRNIILIPSWVHETVKRNGLGISTVLDFKKMRTLLSLQDLAGFLTMENFVSRLTGMPDVHIGSLYFGWSAGILFNEHDVQDFLGKVVSPLADDPSIQKEVAARLFEAGTRESRHENPFICYDLSPEFEGVVINPGFFTQTTDSSLQAELVSAMLKALYVYEPYNEVSKTPLFKRHLELLS